MEKKEKTLKEKILSKNVLVPAGIGLGSLGAGIVAQKYIVPFVDTLGVRLSNKIVSKYASVSTELAGNVLKASKATYSRLKEDPSFEEGYSAGLTRKMTLPKHPTNAYRVGFYKGQLQNKIKSASLDKVYHGSPLTLSEIKHRPSRVLGGEVGIFASPQRWVAVSFCGKWSDADIHQGTINGKPYMKERYAGAFKKVYKNGGYLHTLDGKDFNSDPRLTRFEVYSKKDKAKVLKTEFIADPLQELKRLGVDLIYYRTSKKANYGVKDFDYSPSMALPALGAGLGFYTARKLKLSAPKKYLLTGVGGGAGLLEAKYLNPHTKTKPLLPEEEYNQIRQKDNLHTKINTPSFVRKRQLESELVSLGRKRFNDKYFNRDYVTNQDTSQLMYGQV